MKDYINLIHIDMEENLNAPRRVSFFSGLGFSISESRIWNTLGTLFLRTGEIPVPSTPLDNFDFDFSKFGGKDLIHSAINKLFKQQDDKVIYEKKGRTELTPTEKTALVAIYNQEKNEKHDNRLFNGRKEEETLDIFMNNDEVMNLLENVFEKIYPGKKLEDLKEGRRRRRYIAAFINVFYENNHDLLEGDIKKGKETPPGSFGKVRLWFKEITDRFGNIVGNGLRSLQEEVKEIRECSETYMVGALRTLIGKIRSHLIPFFNTQLAFAD